MAEKQAREYPAMVYSADASKIVASQAEYDALQGNWFDSPADVKEMQEQAHPVTGQVPAAESTSAPGETASLPEPIGPNPTPRDHLLFEADALGLKVDKRWSDETLRRQIFEFASQ